MSPPTMSKRCFRLGVKPVPQRHKILDEMSRTIDTPPPPGGRVKVMLPYEHHLASCFESSTKVEIHTQNRHVLRAPQAT
jgi:hypothetical protein